MRILTFAIGVAIFTAGAANVLISKVTAGGYHTCALTTTGLVKCWGWGLYGQLGYGNTNDVLTPASVGYVNVGGNVTQIAAGGEHTCALTTTGQVKCWGKGDYGQLGYNDTNNVLTSASVGYVNVGGNVTQIVAGDAHTCALTTTGLFTCWGWGAFGQLGYNDTINVLTPASVGYVNVGSNVTQIVAGGYHTCALTTTGLVKCWGYNYYGQCGYGNTNNVLTPAPVGYVNVGSNVTQFTAGGTCTCALTTTGLVKCWGGEALMPMASLVTATQIVS
jgi:alpha-tubulin suppressor-like RCC1 family protein